MDKNSKLYCRWADRGLALHNSGGALLCCHSRTFLQDQNQQQIFWHSHSLDDALASETRKEIRSALDQGIQHPNCNACWEVENAGGLSRRLATNLVELDMLSGDSEQPLLLDLKLGNICNLKCRTCNPMVSSRWYSDWWHIYEKQRSRYTDYTSYLDGMYLDGKKSYDQSNEIFWQDLAQKFPHARYIDIYGAEPMMIDKLFDILQASIDAGHSQHQTLHFNTNGSIWNQHYVDILTQFKKVYVDVSIDGLYRHYDYLRHGSTWDNTRSNLDLWNSMAKKHSNIILGVVVTISTFNIYYLDEIYDYFDKAGFVIGLNEAHKPDNICAKFLPDSAKQQVIAKLRRSPNPRFLNRVEPVIGYMMGDRNDWSTGIDHWSEFVRATLQLDQRRKESFSETFPELYDLVAADFES